MVSYLSEQEIQIIQSIIIHSSKYIQNYFFDIWYISNDVLVQHGYLKKNRNKKQFTRTQHKITSIYKLKRKQTVKYMRNTKQLTATCKTYNAKASECKKSKVKNTNIQ